MYESLLTYGAEGIGEPEVIENVMTLLSETRWDDDVDVVKPIRNQICDLLSIPHPTSLLRPVPTPH
jgi:hypothetical protein